MTGDVGRVRVGHVDRLPGGTHFAVDADPSLTIWRLADGALVASDDECPHWFWSLRLVGTTDGWTVTCRVHEARFDLVTGRKLEGPVCRDLTVHPVVVSDLGEVTVLKSVSPT